jgi:hypothetical protein
MPHASTGTFSTNLIQDVGADMSGYLGARRHGTEHTAKFESLRNSDLLIADASSDPDTLAYVISETERRRVMQEETYQQTNSFFRPFGVFFDIDSTDMFTGSRRQPLRRHEGRTDRQILK